MGWPHWGLSTRILAIMVLVLALDFAVNVALFERANDFALPIAKANRLADQLARAARQLTAAPADRRQGLARQLSSPDLQLEWTDADRGAVSGIELGTLERQLQRLQPGLVLARLHILISPLRVDGLTGTMTLPEGSTLRFHSRTPLSWTLALGHLADFLLPSTAFAALAWLLTYAVLRPLRKLVRASLRVGTGRTRPLAEAGPREVRLLIRAFNAMQQRIDALLDANSQTMLAIAHDLRTPLARLQLRLDALGIDEDDRHAVEGDIGEIRDLLASLQSYVELDSDAGLREQLDLAAMAQTLVDHASDRGKVASYHGPSRLVITARPVALRRALSNLVENALHYGGNARVAVSSTPAATTIIVEDDGPGIPPASLDKVLRPFVRLDHARERDTSGMGLGLAIVERAIGGEGGTFVLTNRSSGGLRATIRLPASNTSLQSSKIREKREL